MRGASSCAGSKRQMTDRSPVQQPRTTTGEAKASLVFQCQRASRCTLQSMSIPMLLSAGMRPAVRFQMAVELCLLSTEPSCSLP